VLSGKIVKMEPIRRSGFCIDQGQLNWCGKEMTILLAGTLLLINVIQRLPMTGTGKDF
jgi:hypothetical protein